MALTADSQGIVWGSFVIPANVKAGTKQVKFTGAKGGNAETTFTGQGTVVTNNMRQVTNVMQSYYDPLAQTFMLDNPRQLTGIDLWMTAVGTTQVIVQLRETSVGFPTQTILAEGRLMPEQVTVNQWTSFSFDKPFYALANVEYAVVVLCNDAVSACAISELGKYDNESQNYVTSQPYQVGVLLSSANASTWTSHQDKDLTFRIRARKYTENAHSYPLGKITLDGATDLLISAMTTTPATSADADLKMVFPDGTTRTVSDGQILQFSTGQTGDVTVEATVRATEVASATIEPGTQVVAGTIEKTGTYITRAIEADAEGANVSVIFSARLPSGSNVAVDIAPVPTAGNVEEQVWSPMAASGQPKDLGDSIFEYIYATGATPVAADRIRIRLTLTGSAAARPYVFNLRVSVT